MEEKRRRARTGIRPRTQCPCTNEVAHIDKGPIQAFDDKLNQSKSPPLYTLSPQQARGVLDDIQSQPVVCNSSSSDCRAHVRDMIVPLWLHGIGWQRVLLRIVRPWSAPKDQPLPVLMYFHGGGWILGNRNTHDRLIRELANQAHVAVVFVEYTPAPEAQYPQQLEECYAATEFIVNHSRHKLQLHLHLHLDVSRMAVAGDSVGGNLATVVAMLAQMRAASEMCKRESSLPIVFRAQLLFYPVTNADFNTGSYCTFADGPWLTKKAMQWFWNAYLPDISARASPFASPLRAPAEWLQHLPPALVITDENDVLRDEGEAYARKLTDAGVPVVHVRYLGTHHDFMMLNPLASSMPTRAAISQAAQYLSNLFWR